MYFYSCGRPMSLLAKDVVGLSADRLDDTARDDPMVIVTDLVIESYTMMHP